MPSLNYGWSNYTNLTEWLNDNVTDGIIEPNNGTSNPNMFGGFGMSHQMLNGNTSGSLTIKYFVTEYCIQDAEELTDRFETALDGADTSPDDRCTDMSPYSWENYLNVLEAKITQLSSRCV